MKKSLFMFGVVVVLSFLVCNVYGAKTNYSTADDLYSYLNTIDSMTYVRKIGATSHDTLKSSDLFVSTSSNYNYYVIFGTDVFFFNYLPTVPYFCFTDYSVNIVYLSLNFEKANVKYAKFSFDLDTGNPTSELSTYYVGSENYELQYGPSIGFYNDFFAKEDFYNLFDSNFELVYSSTGEAVVQKKTEFSFIPTYSENYETCNLKLDIKNPPDYYTLEYAINSSNSTWYQFDNSVGVTVSDNCLVIVRMLDENGDEIFANSINVNLLNGDFSNYKFKVDFDTPDSENLNFTPVLYNDPFEYYDIVFSLNSVSLNDIHDGAIKFSTNGQTFSYKEYTNISSLYLESGTTYYLQKAGAVEFILEFKIINKETGVVALTKSFKFKWSGVNDFPQAISSSTNNTQDSIFNSGGGSNINENLFASDSLEIDWSTENATETAKTFFNSTVGFLNVIVAYLSVLPAWIISPLYILFILLIILFVIKFVRG